MDFERHITTRNGAGGKLGEESLKHIFEGDWNHKNSSTDHNVFSDVMEDRGLSNHQLPTDREDVSDHENLFPNYDILANDVQLFGSPDSQLQINKNVGSSDAKELPVLDTINGSSYQDFSSLGSPLYESKNSDLIFIKATTGSYVPHVEIGASDSHKNLSCLSSFNPADADDIASALTFMNLRAAATTENDRVQQLKLQQEIMGRENILLGSHAANSKLLDIPSIMHSKSDFKELNKNVCGRADSQSSVAGLDNQIKYHTTMNPSAWSHYNISSTSRGTSQIALGSQYANADNQELDIAKYPPTACHVYPASQSMIANNSSNNHVAPTFGTIAVTSPRNEGFATQALNVPEIHYYQAGKPDLSSHRLPFAQQQCKRHGKAVEDATQAIAIHDASQAHLSSADDFTAIMAIHEECISNLLEPEGKLVVGTSAALKNQYDNAAMDVETSCPRNDLANVVAYTSNFQKSSRDVTAFHHFDRAGNKDLVSPFLEKFMQAKTSSLLLTHIQGNVVELSINQRGSRFIQQRLETASLEEKTMVFDEILPHFFRLATDIFANYMVQKFFEHATSSQRRKLAECHYGRVLDLSLHPYGCRVVQKALEFCDLYEKIAIAKELNGSVIRCINDQSGNHVIQKCIEFVPQEHIRFIISEICGNIEILSYHSYGCRVVQKALEKFNPVTQHIMIEEILENIVGLSMNQHGNYVVQQILKYGNLFTRSTIIRKFAGHIVRMSKDKFASNVIEKALLFGSREDHQFIVNEILDTNDDIEALEGMMKDMFGNYVVQKALEMSDDWQQKLILARIKDKIDILQKYNYGKRIVSRINKIVMSRK